LVWQYYDGLLYSKTAFLSWCDSIMTVSVGLVLLKNCIFELVWQYFDGLLYSKTAFLSWCDSIMLVSYTQKPRFWVGVTVLWRSLLLKNCIFELVWQYYDGLFYSKTTFLSWCDSIMTVSVALGLLKNCIFELLWQYYDGLLYSKTAFLRWCDKWDIITVVYCVYSKTAFLRWCDRWDSITAMYCVYPKTAFLRWCDITVSCVRCVLCAVCVTGL
jgi:hypothetical protein